MGARILGTLDLRTEARPHLERNRARAGQSVNLAVRDGSDAISIDYVIGTNSMQVVSKLGQRVPIHCSASGKALVLDLDSGELARVLGSEPYTRYTDNTILTAVELARQAAISRKRGWVFNDEETELGMRAIGVPIRDHTGAIVACISLSAPTFRMDRARVRILANARWRPSRESAAIGAEVTWPPTR